jgi:alkaline phosphatase D
MTVNIDRRSLLQGGLFGIGALTLPGNAAALLAARGFTHNVASGEPRQHSVLLWTRYVPRSGDSARLTWEVSPSPSFSRIASSGEAIVQAAHDFTVKPVAGGLAPGRWYYFRFRDRHGHSSPVGRTRTLPDGPVDRFKLALFSCSNIGFGWFNAYAHAAARRDLDLTIHVGDYLYEYQRNGYPSLEDTVRRVVPTTELIHLADYRMRYASYRSDADLQQLHARFPMIAMWDDHESANDSWVGGAENHQPATEGPWSARKAAAVQAYHEWLPVSADWEDYDVGELATIFKIETRLTARTKQLWLPDAVKGKPDLDAAIVTFRDGPWQDPARTLMGPEQERWLADAFRRSTARGAKWQVLAQQTVMGPTLLPTEAANWSPPNNPSAIDLAASRLGLPFNLDNWDGYPAARQRLLTSAANANANLIVLSGDSHNAWAYDHDVDGAPVGVEFGGQSVTSPGWEKDLTAVAPAELARELIARNPTLKWADTSRRGYVTVELTPAKATGEWLFMDTIRQRSTRLSGTHLMSADFDARRFAA